MHSLSDQYLDAIALNATDAASLAAIGAFRGRQELFTNQTPELLSALRDTAVIESSESSNRIEGVTAAHERIEALVRNNSQPRDRSEQEIAGYRDALTLIHESGAEMPFSVNVIRQLHTMLYRYTGGRGGEWKMTRNDIIEIHPNGTRRVRFSPPDPVVVPGLMTTLEVDYARARDLAREPLIVVPLAILDFLSIHPFSDGNGRTGRLLSLMLLYQSGYDVGRYVSLERIIEESKVSYYEALEQSSRAWREGTHDPLPWLRYFWGMLIAAYKEFEVRVGTASNGERSKSQIVEAAVGRQLLPFSISEIEAESPGVSREWVRKILRRLKDEGRISSTGKGRGAKWLRHDN